MDIDKDYMLRQANELIHIQIAELQALREWKAKASAMLRHEWITLKFNHDMFEDNQPLQDIKKLAILTELLKEGENEPAKSD